MDIGFSIKSVICVLYVLHITHALYVLHIRYNTCVICI
jgi:hypothetical protein